MSFVSSSIWLSLIWLDLELWWLPSCKGQNKFLECLWGQCCQHYLHKSPQALVIFISFYKKMLSRNCGKISSQSEFELEDDFNLWALAALAYILYWHVFTCWFRWYIYQDGFHNDDYELFKSRAYTANGIRTRNFTKFLDNQQTYNSDFKPFSKKIIIKHYLGWKKQGKPWLQN